MKLSTNRTWPSSMILLLMLACNSSCINYNVNGAAPAIYAVPDRGNNRVLIWFEPPSGLSQPADLVIGQPNFFSTSANAGGATAQNSLSAPAGVCTDGRHFVVADIANNRALLWNSLPRSVMASAKVVLGQPDFNSNLANQGAGNPSATTMSGPWGCLILGSKLFIVERGNNRVLVWNTIPTQNDQPADFALGQPNFYTAVQGSNAQGFYQPRSGITAAQGRLFVNDGPNNRILVWNSIPTQMQQPADIVLGQTSMTDVSANGGGSASAATLSGPNNLYTDGQRLVVADYSNHRALIWNSLPTVTGQAADVVLGQPDFLTTTHPVSATNANLEYPAGIMSAHQGRLYIGDEGFGRILVWNSFPTLNNYPSDSVLGQSSFTAGNQNCGTSATSQCFANPWGMASTGLFKGVTDPGGY